ncbi:MAG: DUF4440 domain-containing protein [Limisphaerales bacterium]
MDANPLQSSIRELEERLMLPRVRNNASVASALLADEFVEVGSSGRVYDKKSVLSALANDPRFSFACDLTLRSTGPPGTCFDLLSPSARRAG